MVRYLAITLAALFVASCAGTRGMMMEQQPAAARADEATVVFMRATALGSAISASVFDITGPDNKFVGIIGNRNKIAYTVKPGTHRFMVVSEAADFLEASVLPGKTYYAMVTPRMGVWKARFSFRPVRNHELSGGEFSNWDTGTTFVANTPASLQWAARNAGDVASKRAAHWPEWASKPADQRASQTLNATDGR